MLGGVSHARVLDVDEQSCVLRHGGPDDQSVEVPVFRRTLCGDWNLQDLSSRNNFGAPSVGFPSKDEIGAAVTWVGAVKDESLAG